MRDSPKKKALTDSHNMSEVSLPHTWLMKLNIMQPVSSRSTSFLLKSWVLKAPAVSMGFYTLSEITIAYNNSYNSHT